MTNDLGQFLGHFVLNYVKFDYQRTYSTVFLISPCIDVLYTPFMDAFILTVENNGQLLNMRE